MNLSRGYLVDIYGLKTIFFVSFVITLIVTGSFCLMSRSAALESAIAIE